MLSPSPQPLFSPAFSHRCDTVLIMEAKKWCCRIFGLVCTARLDLRLSLLVQQYAAEYQAGIWSADSSGMPSSPFGMPSSPFLNMGVEKAKRPKATTSESNKGKASSATSGVQFSVVGASAATPAATLAERHESVGSLVGGVELGGEGPMSVEVGLHESSRSFARSKSFISALGLFGGAGSRFLKSRRECLGEIKQVFNLREAGDIVAILCDLMRYDSYDLASSATSLLLRQFEERRVLAAAGRQVQLLVRPHMVESVTTLEGLVHRLGKLAANRRLYSEELYEAAWLVGLLTIQCYDKQEDGAAGAADDDGASTVLSATTHAKSALEVDQSDTRCLTCIGRVRLMGKDAQFVAFEKASGAGGVPGVKTAVPYVRSIVWIGGESYRVRKLSDGGKVLMLNRPVVAGTLRPDEWAWLQLEHCIQGPNHDTQLLLSRLGADQLALKVLCLPYDMYTVREREAPLRALLCAALRLLKAMCTGFPLVQAELAKHLMAFAKHTEARLYEADISPTECIITICNDNRDACTKVPSGMVRDFAQLAGRTKQPRFLRFLRTIMMPSGDGKGSVIQHNQDLVVSSLVDTRDALLLFNDEAGQAERTRLVEANDLEVNPRGRLMYHIELIGMLASMSKGDSETRSFVRDVLSAKDAIHHVLQPPVQLDAPAHVLHALLPLKANYLAIFRDAFVGASTRALPRPLHLLAEGTADELLCEMARLVHDFIEKRLSDEPTNFAGDEQAAAELTFIGEAVLPLMSAFFCSEHAKLAMQDVDVHAASANAAKAIQALLDAIAGDEHRLIKGRLSPRDCHKSLLAIIHLGVAIKLGPDQVAFVRADEDSGGHARPLSAIHLADSPGAIDVLAAHPAGPSPQDNWLDFVEAFERDAGTDDEYHDLVRTFMEDLERSLQHSLSKREKRRTTPVPLQQCLLACVVRQLENGRPRDGEPLGEDALGPILAALRILDKVLDEQLFGFTASKRTDQQKERGEELRMRQDVLVQLGVPRICLVMVLSRNVQLCEVGLRLGNSLLRGGNRKAQTAFYELVSDPLGTRTMRAFDGGDGHATSFLEKMRQLLRLGKVEMTEAKLYRQQQRERLEAFKQESREIRSDATKIAMLQELSKPFPSRSFVSGECGVLEMLRLLTENHCVEMQELLREQPSQTGPPVDLVSEIFDLFAALEAELDDVENVQLATYCVATLTELVQGNNGGGNSRLLTASKLINVCGRLLLLHKVAGAAQESFNVLRDAITKLMMALLEGSDHAAERRMLMCLDVSGIARMVSRLHKESEDLEGALARAEQEAEEKQREEEGGVTRVASGATQMARQLTRRLTQKLTNAGTSSSDTLPPATSSLTRKAADQFGKNLGAVGAVGGKMSKNVGEVGSKIGKNVRFALMQDLELERRRKKLAASRDAGFSLCLLLHHLLDFERQHLPCDGPRRVHDVFSEDWFQEAKEFFSEFIASVEIVNQSGDLERVFFRFPQFCLLLTDEQKHALEWKMDRETPGAQLVEFIEAADELHFVMKYESKLEKWWLWRFSKRWYGMAQNSIFLLAVLANVLLVVRSHFCLSTDGSTRVWSDQFCSRSAQQAVIAHHEAEDEDGGRALSAALTTGNVSNVELRVDRQHWAFVVHTAEGIAAWEEQLALGLQVGIFALGVLLCLAPVVVFVLDAVRHGYPRIHRLVFKYAHKFHFVDAISKQSAGTFEDIAAAVQAAPWRHAPWFYPLCVGAFFADYLLWFCMATFASTVVGLTTSPYWFAFGLLDFASKSPEVRIVGSVLFQNSRSIVMTVVFMILIIYIFAVSGYLHLAKWFFYIEETSDTPIPSCTSLLQCFVTVFDDGLRANDIGAYIEPIRPGDLEPLSGRDQGFFYFYTVYTMLFWFIVCIILLNVIFGIIIDSFAELRAHRQMIQGKIDNECFVCGIDRFTLDTQGGGFEAHVERDHDKWEYLFLMVMLREKDPSDYNGWESHVAAHLSSTKLERPSSSFMPRNNALALKEHKEREEAESRRQAEQAGRTAALVEKMSDALKGIITRQDDLDRKLSRLGEGSARSSQALTARASQKHLVIPRI